MDQPISFAESADTGRLSRPPGPKGLPLLGSLLAFGRGQLDFLTQNARAYGDIVVADNSLIDSAPGGLRGLELAKIVAATDALILPVGHSVFDRESAAQCVAELRQLSRVAAGRCRVGVVGMRLDTRTRGEAVLRAWAGEHGLPFVGALRETQGYVRCAEQGLTMFDLPAARVQADLDQWRPILDWLQPVLSAAPRSAAGVPDEAEPAARAATPRREPVHRPRFSPSTAQVPLDVLEGPRERGGWLARVAAWLGHATSRRRPLRGT